MEIENMKNIILIKNLPSNIIEEAFVVVKPNLKIKQAKLIDKERTTSSTKKENNSKDYIVKEAEMLISEYISNMDNIKNKKQVNNLEKKYKKLKNMNIFLILISFIIMISFIIK